MLMRWAAETVCPSTVGTLKLRGIAHESANGRPFVCSRANGLLQRVAVLGEVETFDRVLLAHAQRNEERDHLRAFPGKVDTGFPKGNATNIESRALPGRLREQRADGNGSCRPCSLNAERIERRSGGGVREFHARDVERRRFPHNPKRSLRDFWQSTTTFSINNAFPRPGRA